MSSVAAVVSDNNGPKREERAEGAFENGQKFSFAFQWNISTWLAAIGQREAEQEC